MYYTFVRNLVSISHAYKSAIRYKQLEESPTSCA